jgi:Na+-driven multidrug efflux pump
MDLIMAIAAAVGAGALVLIASSRWADKHTRASDAATMAALLAAAATTPISGY